MLSETRYSVTSRLSIYTLFSIAYILNEKSFLRRALARNKGEPGLHIHEVQHEGPNMYTASILLKENTQDISLLRRCCRHPLLLSVVHPLNLYTVP